MLGDNLTVSEAARERTLAHNRIYARPRCLVFAAKAKVIDRRFHHHKSLLVREVYIIISPREQYLTRHRDFFRLRQPREIPRLLITARGTIGLLHKASQLHETNCSIDHRFVIFPVELYFRRPFALLTVSYMRRYIFSRFSVKPLHITEICFL